ncbi:MAG TPA: hypothetical protein VFW16_07960 [Streptosporangiaceae bacterium]|nr:hypothetical protein [Streptosporangiaceae bacterium]
MTDQGYPPRRPANAGRPGRTRVSHEPRRSGWQVIDAFDEGQDDSEPPPWAGPSGIEPLRPARRPPRVQAGGQRLDAEPGQADEPQQEAWPAPELPGRVRRGPRRGRAAAARRRRSKRRLVTWGAVAIAVVVATGLGIYLAQSPAKKSPFVTKLQKGEFRTVPDACKVVGMAVLHQIMHGTPRSIQPQQGQAQSECTFTVDASPVFRVMNVNLAALRASLVPVGDGGATANATYTFTRQAAQLRTPPKHTAQPPARTTAVPGLGQQAIIAVQTFSDKGATDKVTVLVRFRNVLITVSLQGQSGHGFGPATTGELRSGALTVARAALTGVKGEPVV